MRLPKPAPKPLELPGSSIEGTLVYAVPKMMFENDGVEITLRTGTGTNATYWFNQRVYRLLYEAVGDGEDPYIRITRLDDSPSVGGKSPKKNYRFEVGQPAPPPQPVALPQPVAAAQPQQPAAAPRRAPAW